MRYQAISAFPLFLGFDIGLYEHKFILCDECYQEVFEFLISSQLGFSKEAIINMIWYEIKLFFPQIFIQISKLKKIFIKIQENP